MATRYTSLDEIHRIIFDAPDDSDDSIQSWEEDSDEEISDPDEAEDVQNQNLQRDFGNEEMHSTSEIRVRTQNRNRSSGKRQTVPEINWGELDEVVNVAYPEFSGPEHGPVHNFDVDSEPVVFFDQLFTDELWDLLVTETNSLGQNVSVDEAMVKGKGRNPVKQYMPMKPIKQGSKLWCIGCSCCAYLWDFELYAGKEKGTAKQGLSSRVVCDLCHPTLDNRGHVIYMDNFFTSIALCKTLKGFGTYTVGTLCSNRLGYPKCLTDKPLLKTMKR